jgi:DNA helicase II / ATP-dependent DNA helicase PcrA
VLAGAGSGKTRVLTARIAYLIQDQGVAPERLFAVTFTNKAAGEMRARVAALLGADPRGLWIGTFHALSARLLRREAPRLGFGTNFTIYDQDDSEALTRRLLEQRGLSPKAYSPRNVHWLISEAKNRLVTPEEFAGTADGALARAAADVFADLGPALQQANAMDFDDLLLHPLALFRSFPDRLQYWQRRFDHVLVDEFQDTNAAQYQLVTQLAAGHRNLCAVGDDDQAIYGWRGADVRHMLAFPRDFPDATVVKLEQNYRSTQIILDAANGVIAENAERLGKSLFTERAGGDPVTVLTAADERDEAQWLMGEFAARAAERDVPYDEMAVLYRTNAQSRAFEDACRARGVPYRLVGAVSFYDRREVKDLLAYLRLLVNPADDEAFLRVVNVPRRGLGEASVELLVRAAARWRLPLLEAARVADRIPDIRPNVRDACGAFGGLISELAARCRTEDPATALQAVIAATGYERYLADEGPEGVERLENVEELLAGAAEWTEEALATNGTGRAAPASGAPDEPAETLVERYLTQAALVSPADEQAPAGVTLMTVHMAKGLEWPIVALAGLEDGLFPLARSAGVPGGLEEERRLCYVGLTRARVKLYLSWARMRYRAGRLELSEPSRFLEAVPEGITDRRSTAPRWSGERARPAPTRGAEEEPSQDAPRYVAGERVRHRTFGAGVVRTVTGAGRGLKVTVDFDATDVGTKQLLVAFAGLERDWESE